MFFIRKTIGQQAHQPILGHTVHIKEHNIEIFQNTITYIGDIPDHNLRIEVGRVGVKRCVTLYDEKDLIFRKKRLLTIYYTNSYFKTP